MLKKLLFVIILTICCFAESIAQNTVAGHSLLENLSSKPGIVEVEITASPERLSLLPDTETDVYAYNGQIPGPLLEISEGDSVIIHFRNDLDEETTIHWHGMHLPFVSDGSPFHPVQPGDSYTYRFRVHPGTAGTYWYHPILTIERRGRWEWDCTAE